MYLSKKRRSRPCLKFADRLMFLLDYLVYVPLSLGHWALCGAMFKKETSLLDVDYNRVYILPL